jgi:uncharacterized protein
MLPAIASALLGMAPLSSTSAASAPSFGGRLLDVARTVIRAGVNGSRLQVDADAYPELMRAPRACFVTLYVDRQLHGCIGSLEPVRPLVEDVAHNAYAAGFDDPRFAPLTAADVTRLSIEVSILSPLEPLRFRSESELLAQLRPYVDGLVLQDGAHRGTFLPSVWEQLPDARDFLRQLKCKAGLAADYWSPTIEARRYTVDKLA